MFALLSQWPISKQSGDLEIEKENQVQKDSIIPFPTEATTFQGSQKACRACNCPLFALSQPNNKSTQALNLNINMFIRLIVFTC